MIMAKVKPMTMSNKYDKYAKRYDEFIAKVSRELLYGPPPSKWPIRITWLAVVVVTVGFWAFVVWRVL
jgi:hypothetical protein